MTKISVIGGGPAGSSAALAALRTGADVDLYEKSTFPRHKVCGEFLSPEVADLLDGLGVWNRCQQAAPATIRRVHLYLGKSEKSWTLPEHAHGLSRFALDQVLLESAVSAGAVLRKAIRQAGNTPEIVAHGRQGQAPGKNRLFGFKAHFTGPADDVMRLFFFQGCYVGVNAVEGGKTNVCGLGPESLLRKADFTMEEVCEEHPALRERLLPMSRNMKWLVTGPLVFGRTAASVSSPHYWAGDALGFVDPFTGSGMLGAIATGQLAGESAARKLPVQEYLRGCQQILGLQYQMAAFFRAAIRLGAAETLLPYLPGQILFRLTRPHGKRKSR